MAQFGHVQMDEERKVRLKKMVETAAAGLCGPGEESNICSSWSGVLGTTTLGVEPGVLPNVAAAASRSRPG